MAKAYLKVLLQSIICFFLLCFVRRQELRELRFLQKEEQRAQQQLNGKLQQQRELIFRRFEQEMMVKSLILCYVVMRQAGLLLSCLAPARLALHLK